MRLCGLARKKIQFLLALDSDVEISLGQGLTRHIQMLAGSQRVVSCL
jgi:hypothetical protein